MKLFCRALFVLPLAFGQTVQAAAWIKLFDEPDGGIRYVDTQSIRKTGSVVNVWQMTDYKKNPDGDPYLSTKFQVEFDCGKRMVRNLHFVTYSGNLGKGNVVYDRSLDAKWKPIVPGTIDAGIADHIACASR
jgi:hypothetical protein